MHTYMTTNFLKKNIFAYIYIYPFCIDGHFSRCKYVDCDVVAVIDLYCWKNIRIETLKKKDL